MSATFPIPQLPFLSCPECRNPLPIDPEAAVRFPTRCPRCGCEMRARLFSRVAAPEFKSGELASEGESTCFFHPEKRAATACERCGRFVCELCEIPLGSRKVCPSCLGSGVTAGKLPELIHKRVVWSRCAFLMGALPLVLPPLWAIWPLFIGTGATAIGFALYGWNKPGSLVTGRGRALAILAIVLGACQIAIEVGIFWTLRVFASRN